MARPWHTKRKRRKRWERGKLATNLEMLCPVACLSGLARRRFAKGVLTTDRDYWRTLPIPEPTAQKDFGKQEQDFVAAPQTTPEFIRPAPKSKGKPRRCCLQGWSGSRRADGKGDREAAPSAIKENAIAERQGQAPSMQSVAHQACWKVNGQAEKALLAEGFPASPNRL